MNKLLSVSLSSLLLAFLVTPSVFSQTDQDCLGCHSLAHGATEATEAPLVNMQVCQKSVHIDLGFACTDCHMDIDGLPHADDLAPVDCGMCHVEIQEIYANSVHGQALAEGAEDAPTCARCHGSENLLPSEDPRSPVNPMRIARLCGECHSNANIMSKYGFSSSKQEVLYGGSVHASEVLAGNENAPTCADCHGYHDTLPLRDPESRTNFLNVPETCGDCHETEKDQYLESIHAKSAMSGHKDAPVCTDCHGEHAIFRVEDQRSPVSFFNLAGNTCGRCHASLVINEKYNIPSGQVRDFFQSYHGLAYQRGSKQVANCGSCHGNHLILPSSDPRSTVSPERLVETCGVCHPGISANVLAAPIHSEVTIRSDTIVAWVPRIYIPLIVLVIGGMILHNWLILWSLLKEKFRREADQPRYKRFSTGEIVVHILLTLAFILLAVTGFALRYPTAWWVTLLSYLQMTEEVRMMIHRVSGVVLIATLAISIFYMIFSRRGRAEFVAFFPVPRDIKHVWQNIAYYAGRRSEPPEFDRYDYTEKMEFWALVWGIVIMAVTGLMLWFPILSFQYLPKWAIDMARLIHYYEAVLATLAIVIWHFFFVIFHPEEYPMSVTWLNGKMTLKHLKERHPLEYQRVGKDDLVDPKENEAGESGE